MITIQDDGNWNETAAYVDTGTSDLVRDFSPDLHLKSEPSEPTAFSPHPGRGYRWW